MCEKPSNLATAIESDIKDLFSLLKNKFVIESYMAEDIECHLLKAPEKRDNPLPDNGHLHDKLFGVIHKFDKNNRKLIDFPALYIIELADASQMEVVFKAFNEYRKREDCRRTPACHKDRNSEKVLYVGKVNWNVGGRLSVHFGYGKKPEHHGLQLYHWAKYLQPSLRLNVHVFVMNPEVKELLPYLEKKLANKLIPRIGKHN